MTAFFVSRIYIRDPKKLQEYAKATGPTLTAYGGKLLLKGKYNTALLGASDDHVTSIVAFPNMDSIKAWFASPDYQIHVKLRDEAGEMQFLAYEEP